MANLLQQPPRLPLVLPSILSADFTTLGDDVADVVDRGADGIHIDIMDGHFVPNLTMGPALTLSIRKRFPDLYLDVHLMVSRPEKFVRPFADAGANCLTFHIEPTAGREKHDEHAVIEQIKAAGCDAGIAINPPTPPEAVEHVLSDVDLVLVMSVNPGFSGQKFMTEVLDKTRAIKPKLRNDQRLEMDGGINADTVAGVREAGCDCIVAASYLFGAADRSAAINRLRGAG
jgi:ribulose-phosphate 3-epimerase